MYDELVKSLRHCVATMNCVTCPVDSIDKTAKAQQRCVTLMLAQAADAIEVLSKMETTTPRWISVEERLPEDEDARYLVASDFMSYGLWVSICYFTHNLESVDEYDFVGERRSGFYFYDSEYGHIEKDDVRYWMPLPEPPKEET